MDADFAEFVQVTQRRILRFALLLTAGDADAAADLAQEALLQVGIRWRRVSDMASPEAYTRTVMSRLWWRQSAKARRDVLTDEPIDGGVSIHRPEWETPVWQAIQSLPARQRAVLVLRYYEDMSEAEIARVMRCRQGTVKSQASRGLVSLRNRLQQLEAAEHAVNGSREEQK